MRFDKWFKEQCGKRPRSVKVSDERLKELILKGAIAKQELNERLRYDAMLKAALYAWQIKDQEKE